MTLSPSLKEGHPDLPKGHPPTQNTTGLHVEKCENGGTSASADVRPFLERRMKPAKLPNKSFGAKKDHIQKGTATLVVGLHEYIDPV